VDALDSREHHLPGKLQEKLRELEAGAREAVSGAGLEAGAGQGQGQRLEGRGRARARGRPLVKWIAGWRSEGRQSQCLPQHLADRADQSWAHSRQGDLTGQPEGNSSPEQQL